MAVVRDHVALHKVRLTERYKQHLLAAADDKAAAAVVAEKPTSSTLVVMHPALDEIDVRLPSSGDGVKVDLYDALHNPSEPAQTLNVIGYRCVSRDLDQWTTVEPVALVPDAHLRVSRWLEGHGHRVTLFCMVRTVKATFISREDVTFEEEDHLVDFVACLHKCLQDVALRMPVGGAPLPQMAPDTTSITPTPSYLQVDSVTNLLLPNDCLNEVSAVLACLVVLARVCLPLLHILAPAMLPLAPDASPADLSFSLSRRLGIVVACVAWCIVWLLDIVVGPAWESTAWLCLAGYLTWVFWNWTNLQQRTDQEWIQCHTSVCNVLHDIRASRATMRLLFWFLQSLAPLGRTLLAIELVLRRFPPAVWAPVVCMALSITSYYLCWNQILGLAIASLFIHGFYRRYFTRTSTV